MAVETNFSDAPEMPGSSDAAGQGPRAPGWRWMAGWTLLMTAAIPVALACVAPLTAVIFWNARWGANAGLWASPTASLLMPFGFGAALALCVAGAQWAMLRRLIPHAWQWFVATVAGFTLAGLSAALVLRANINSGGDPYWAATAAFLLTGLALGLAQWLVLRRIVHNAGWIIGVDVLAAGSILLAGRSFTSLLELLVIIFLPGLVTGAGMALLLRQAHPHPAVVEAVQASGGKPRRIPRLAWALLGLVLLVPLFFGCSYVYAVSQLALAKDAGIYPTVEEAVVKRNSQGWGGAKVVRIENVRAGTNNFDGSMPHVAFGEARVYLDHAPQGYDWTDYSSGSFYIHVRDGWVYVGEGAFPEFIGWVMQLYGLEGVER